MSNSENIILSEKDPNSMKSLLQFPACRAPIRSSLQDRRSVARIGSDSEEDCDRKQRKQPEKEEGDSKENLNTIGSGKGLEVNRARDEVDENDDGFRTPTSLDRKLPAVWTCPPPPRKPRPPPSMKRRAPRRRVLLDLSNEIELLFPPAVLADLGNGINKIRQANR